MSSSGSGTAHDAFPVAGTAVDEDAVVRAERDVEEAERRAAAMETKLAKTKSELDAAHAALAESKAGIKLASKALADARRNRRDGQR